MKVERVLALPEGFEVTHIEEIDGILTISAVSTQPSVCCPLCSSVGTRLHGHYTRTIADLPCAGQPVRRLLQVRKFFCDKRTCPRKIEASRITPFARPWARVTVRLSESVQSIGFATGGMLGARLTDRLGIQTCPIAILRRMMACLTAPVERVVELGIDDFAFRRGRKFGSILVDMQSHNVIDPRRPTGRQKAPLPGWVRIQKANWSVVTRVGDYAAGARQGAPQAVQVADRFHFYKNLVEAVELILARCRAEIRKNAQSAVQQELQEEAPKPLLYEHAEVIARDNWKPEPQLCDERARLSRRAQRYDR